MSANEYPSYPPGFLTSLLVLSEVGVGHGLSGMSRRTESDSDEYTGCRSNPHPVLSHTFHTKLLGNHEIPL